MMSPSQRLLLAVVVMAGCSDSTGPTAGPDTRFVSVAAGAAFTCGLVRDGRVLCWGWGESGQLGDSTLTSRAAPSAVAGTERFTALSARGESVCALTAAGAAWCWGRNDGGLLGLPEASCHPIFLSISCFATPTRVDGPPPLRSLTLGSVAACGLSGSDVWCWGRDLTVQAVVDPLKRIADTAAFAAVAVGRLHACGVTTSGALRCWGYNSRGQLGIGTTTGFAAVPVPAGLGHAWRAVAAAGDHTCGIDTAGIGYCWGYGPYGLLGLDTLSLTPGPAAVSDSLRFTYISTGSYHTCAVTTDGAVYCWGENVAGALGLDPGWPSRGVPSAVENAPRGAVSVSVGDRHTCAVTELGEAWCWGLGTAGQLGRGDFASSSVPERVVMPEVTP